MYSDDITPEARLFVVWSVRPLGHPRKQPMGMVYVHIDGREVDQMDFRISQAGVYEATMQAVAEIRRLDPAPWELKNQMLTNELPDGKQFLSPDWTNGVIRVWHCAA